MKNTIKLADHGHTLMVAHKGLSGIEQENTCSAYVAAGNRSYFGIETDVRMTSDGRYVLLHDRSTERLSGAAVSPESATFEELRRVRYKDRDGSFDRGDLIVPELGEYVKICKTYGKTCVLELKDYFSEEMCRGLVDVIKEKDYLDGMIYIAFSFETLLNLRRILPGCTAQFLTGKQDPVAQIDRLVENGFGIDAYWETLTEENVALMRSKGITVNCWTVDDPDAAARLIGWGVDQLTTNILE
jgi:glycerophosphoryl diester phosphodiesterase